VPHPVRFLGEWEGCFQGGPLFAFFTRGRISDLAGGDTTAVVRRAERSEACLSHGATL